MPRPFRFGVQCSAPPAGQGAGWADTARRCEALGYDTLTVADHLDDQLAITPALMAAADATTTLRVGALVYCNDYRHPVVLAKEAATIDLLSGGRLELGLGAGWMTSDYEQSGITLDSPGTRIARLAEAIDVIEGLLAGSPFSYEGTHYRLTELTGTPRPAQAPRPPLLLGGGGRRMLSLAGARADIVGINVDLREGVIDTGAGPNATIDATDAKIAWVREAAGSRDIELQVRVHLTLVTDDRAGMAELLATGFGLAPDEALASPHALCGTVEEIAEDLQVRRERWGISYIGISADAMEAFAPVVAALRGR